jgi:hypothetical protein
VVLGKGHLIERVIGSKRSFNQKGHLTEKIN